MKAKSLVLLILVCYITGSPICFASNVDQCTLLGGDWIGALTYKGSTYKNQTTTFYHSELYGNEYVAGGSEFKLDVFVPCSPDKYSFTAHVPLTGAGTCKDGQITFHADNVAAIPPFSENSPFYSYSVDYSGKIEGTTISIDGTIRYYHYWEGPSKTKGSYTFHYDLYKSWVF